MFDLRGYLFIAWMPVKITIKLPFNHLSRHMYVNEEKYSKCECFPCQHIRLGENVSHRDAFLA